MKKRYYIYILVLLALLGVIFIGHGGAKGDKDHAQDCWAHAVSGLRHCATN